MAPKARVDCKGVLVNFCNGLNPSKTLGCKVDALAN